MIYSYKSIWQITAPILIGLLIHQLVGITDTIFLGHLGEIELGASALGGVFYIVLFMLGHGFSAGVQIIIARRHGESNCHKTAEVFYQSVIFLILTALVMIIITLFLAEDILSLFISSNDVLNATIAYVKPRVWGLLFAFIIVNFRAFFVGITYTKILAINALVMLIINIVFDYGLIFGKLGMPELGIEGSAIASVIAEAGAVLFFAIYLLTRIDYKKFGFNQFRWWNKKILYEIFNLSFWTTMQSVIGLSTWMFFLIAIENLGEKELAISNILRSISSLTFMIIAALSSTANTITSNLIGCNSEQNINLATGRIIKLAYWIGLPVTLFLLVFYEPVTKIYTDNPNLLENIFAPYAMMLSSYITLVPGMIWLSVISGTGRTKLGMNIEFVCLAVYVFMVWYLIIYLRTNLTWAWSCEQYYNFPLLAITWYYLYKKKIKFQNV